MKNKFCSLSTFKCRHIATQALAWPRTRQQSAEALSYQLPRKGH